MSYPYLALIDCDLRSRQRRNLDQHPALFESGLTKSCELGPIQLFTAARTPTVRLGNSAILIGHAFLYNGNEISKDNRIALHVDHSRFHEYFASNYWGSYLLFQYVPGTDVCTVTRDSEGGIACLHSLSQGRGFITSDIRLPVRAGLCQRQTDWQFIAHRLIYPQIKTTRTGFKGVRELLPGCRLTVDSRSAEQDPLWSPWPHVSPERRYRSIDQAAEAVREAIDGVIRAWARTDHRVLMELSGGLDSSIVAASLGRTGANVSCCTYTTPVPGADERSYAWAVARLLDFRLDVQALPLEDACLSFPTGSDLPTARVGILQNAADRIMEQAAARHDTVSYMSGAGGDTAFCFLPTAAPAADALRQRGPFAALTAITELAEMHQCTSWRAARLTVRKLFKSPITPYLPCPHLLGPAVVGCDPERHPWLDIPRDAVSGDRERIVALAVAQTYREGAPRGSDRHLRFPLLSQPVTEATLRAPSWMWISGGRNRALARMAYADSLPSVVISRKSKGTFTAYVGALFHRNKAALREFLLDGELGARGFIDHDALKVYLDQDVTHRDDNFHQTLELCAVENWVRHQ